MCISAWLVSECPWLHAPWLQELGLRFYPDGTLFMMVQASEEVPSFSGPLSTFLGLALNLDSSKCLGSGSAHGSRCRVMAAAVPGGADVCCAVRQRVQVVTPVRYQLFGGRGS